MECVSNITYPQNLNQISHNSTSHKLPPHPNHSFAPFRNIHECSLILNMTKITFLLYSESEPEVLVHGLFCYTKIPCMCTLRFWASLNLRYCFSNYALRDYVTVTVKNSNKLLPVKSIPIVKAQCTKIKDKLLSQRFFISQ